MPDPLMDYRIHVAEYILQKPTQEYIGDVPWVVFLISQQWLNLLSKIFFNFLRGGATPAFIRIWGSEA